MSTSDTAFFWAIPKPREQEELRHRRQETAVWAERTVRLGKGGEVAWEEWREV